MCSSSRNQGLGSGLNPYLKVRRTRLAVIHCPFCFWKQNDTPLTPEDYQKLIRVNTFKIYQLYNPAWIPPVLETMPAYDWLYPENIQLSRHPDAAEHRKISPFPGKTARKKILDYRQRCGKFPYHWCQLFPDNLFYGIEQRRELYDHAMAAKAFTGLENADFIHGNFTQAELGEYDNFYFYNSFFENLDEQGRIDNLLEYSVSPHIYYSRYLFRAPDARPSGTRLVTPSQPGRRSAA